MTFLAVLGRQPGLSLAELERIYGSDAVEPLSPSSARVEADTFDVDRFGGTVKAGKIVATIHASSWKDVNNEIVQRYDSLFKDHSSKITLGISAYDFPQSLSARDVQKTGIILKQRLKKRGVSLRLLPNTEPALNSAASHHNKLGSNPNKVELLVARTDNGSIAIAESVGSQNISAFAARDQARPKTDAFVGMLPPKLAMIMVNLACTGKPPANPRLRVLDPFCGTGVILQEAALFGYDVYGTDLSEKMIDYSSVNLQWLSDRAQLSGSVTIHHGDAIETRWQRPIDAVVSEVYLGQPFSAPPAPDKLTKVRRICSEITVSFLTNLKSQIASGTQLCIAVPAWRDTSGNLSHLALLDNLSSLGYRRIELKHVSKSELVYFRDTQVVARELLILERL